MLQGTRLQACDSVNIITQVEVGTFIACQRQGDDQLVFWGSKLTDHPLIVSVSSDLQNPAEQGSAEGDCGSSDQQRSEVYSQRKRRSEVKRRQVVRAPLFVGLLGCDRGQS